MKTEPIFITPILTYDTSDKFWGFKEFDVFYRIILVGLCERELKNVFHISSKSKKIRFYFFKEKQSKYSVQIELSSSSLVKILLDDYQEYLLPVDTLHYLSKIGLRNGIYWIELEIIE